EKFRVRIQTTERMRFMRKMLPVFLAVAAVSVAIAVYSDAVASAAMEEIPDTTMASGLTPLDVYVQTPDPVYRYELVQAQEDEGIRASLLRMTSQEWLSKAEVN